MAIRFDASTDKYSRNTNLPPAATFSMLAWVVLDVNRAATTNILYFGNTGGTAHYIQVNSSGIWQISNPSGTTTGAANTIGVWYHVAMCVAGTGTNQAVMYLNGATHITMNGGTTSALLMQWANDANSRFLNGRLGALKVYDVALTQAEVEVEMRTYVPHRTTSLNGWYPLTSQTLANNVTDFSGLGRSLTEAGTLAVGDGPPIPWADLPTGRSLPLAAVVAGATAPPPRHRPWRFMRRAA